MHNIHAFDTVHVTVIGPLLLSPPNTITQHCMGVSPIIMTALNYNLMLSIAVLHYCYNNVHLGFTKQITQQRIKLTVHY